MHKDKEKVDEKAKNDETPSLEEQLEKAKVEIDHWKNEFYRAYADTKNLRDSLEKDHHDAVKYRSIGFVEQLLPILDSFHVVLSNEPTDPALKNYLIGFQFIYSNIVRVLEQEGVKEISPKIGDTFDPNTMNATDTVEEEPTNRVKAVSGKGYKLHDRLIRPAMVTVSVSKKQEDKTEEKNSQESVENKENTKFDA